jgi:hypothetical protein
MKLAAATCPTKAVWAAWFALLLCPVVSRAADESAKSTRLNFIVIFRPLVSIRDERRALERRRLTFCICP